MLSYPFYVECNRPRRRQLLDQQFGLALTPQDYLSIFPIPHGSQEYSRNWRNRRAAASDVGSTIKTEKDKFQINLDVQHFAPEEISVKTVDGFLIIEGKHEEKQDEHGFISRSFSRRYPLPENVESNSVISKLSSDGVLTVTAPFKVPSKVANERVVPVVRTGPMKKEIESKYIQS